MSDTPIIDAALRKAIAPGGNIEEVCVRFLRSALPWDLPTERLEAMCEEYYNGEAVYEDMKSALQDIYRTDPIMRELYPERWKKV